MLREGLCESWCSRKCATANLEKSGEVSPSGAACGPYLHVHLASSCWEGSITSASLGVGVVAVTPGPRVSGRGGPGPGGPSVAYSAALAPPP